VGPYLFPDLHAKRASFLIPQNEKNFSPFVAVTTDVFRDYRFEKLLSLGKNWLQVYLKYKVMLHGISLAFFHSHTVVRHILELKFKQKSSGIEIIVRREKSENS
jgi:hypothetical protein